MFTLRRGLRDAIASTSKERHRAYHQSEDVKVTAKMPNLAGLSASANARRALGDMSFVRRRMTAVRSQPAPSDVDPRKGRLAMETAWTGGVHGNFESAETLDTIGGHALLLPGSGSQYVGMGSILKPYESANLTWSEASSVLNEFEDWFTGLDLLGSVSPASDAAQLVHLINSGRDARAREQSLYDVTFYGPQHALTRSWNSQPAIFVTSMCFLRTLENEFRAPVTKGARAIAGHSSGAFTAAVASGALSFKDALLLMRLHGLMTSEALKLPSISLTPGIEQPPGSSAMSDLSFGMHKSQMSAVILKPGQSIKDVLEIVAALNATKDTETAHASVEVASLNSASQIVLSGTHEGILRACDVFLEHGIAVLAADLPVGAPYHCSFLSPVAECMDAIFDKIPMVDPKVPMVSYDGSIVTTAADVRRTLVQQIVNPVQWSRSLAQLRRQGIKDLLFIGPGRALLNLARRDFNVTRDIELDDGSLVSPMLDCVASPADLVRVGREWR